MKVLVCPQCGGNEFALFGASAYKCESCGTILKDEPEPKPVLPKSHYVAPVSSFRYDDELPTRTDGSSMDNPDSSATKIILIVVVALVLLGLGGLAVYGSAKPQPVVNSEEPLRGTTEQSQLAQDSILNSIPDIAPAAYTEKGITIKEAELFTDNAPADHSALQRNQQVQLTLSQPKGFTKKNKKVFVGMSIVVKNKKGEELYYSDDINKTAGEAGEDYLRYKDKCVTSFIVSGSFGFTAPGNYTIYYRVWDKKSSNSVTGEIPVFMVD